MNQKPIHLSIDEIYTPNKYQIQSAIKGHDPRFKLKFRDRYPLLSLVLHGILFFGIAGLGLLAAVIIREAIVGGS